MVRVLVVDFAQNKCDVAIITSSFSFEEIIHYRILLHYLLATVCSIR